MLWTLRGLDEELAARVTSLARYPEDRKVLEQRLASERQRLTTHKQRLHDLQLEHRKLEHDIDALQAEERRFQGQLPLVKKNEEYQALLHEITDRREKRSQRETEALRLMEEEQLVEGEGPAIQQTLRRVEEETAARVGAIAEEERRDREEVAALESERGRVAERLSERTRARYERIRASREGRAVVPILKNACGGCYRGQPPQVLQEARRGDRVLSCDGCGRLLVWPPEETVEGAPEPRTG